MKVAVVGGNGNIGFYVAKHLLNLGHDVFCLNRGLSGDIPSGAQHLICDRNEEQSFISAVRAQGFEMAIDMTCYSAKHSRCSIEAFVGVNHFIACSSVATYGRRFHSFPVSESCRANPTTDRNREYAVGKHDADVSFLAAYEEKGFPVTLVKPSISYGPKMGLLRQIGMDPKFISRIESGRPIIMAGDGIALHQFMFSDDVGLAFALLLGKTQTLGQSFNLAQFHPTSWYDYHKTVMEVLGREVEQIGVPAVVLDRLNRAQRITLTDIFWENCHFSTAKLRAVLPEFTPKYTLKEGIALVVDALKRQNRVVACANNEWEDELIDVIRGMQIGEAADQMTGPRKSVLSNLLDRLKN